MVVALGVCLKPHFVLIPLAVTAVAVLRQRSLRPLFSAANLTFLALGLGYVGYVALVHPAYLAQIVPLAREVYGAYGTAFAEVLHNFVVEIMLLLALTIALQVRRQHYADAILVAAVAYAGLGIYLLQSKGFGYQAIPFLAYLIVACTLVIARSPRPNAAVVTAAITIAVVAVFNLATGFYRNDAALQIASVARDLGDVDSLMVVSTTLYVGPPAAIASDARWVSRYPANWLVPGAVNRLAKTDCGRAPETCARLQAIAAMNRADNLADIATAHPDLLVLELRPGYFDTPGFSWEAFMAEDPAWAGVLDDYTEVGRSEHFVY